MVATINSKTDEMDLLQKRTLFIADRVAVCFSIMLAATVALLLGIQMDGTVDRVLSYWWVAFLMPFGASALLLGAQRQMYFKLHWGVIALLNAAIWFPITIIVGLALDKFLVGVGNAFWTSVNFLFAYTLGYVAARWFAVYRHVSKSQSNRIGLGVYMAFLLVVGMLVFPMAMVRVVETCTGGTINMMHFIFCAFAVPVACLLNYYMLFALHDTHGMNVQQDPPNKLFFVCIRNTVLLVLIFWVLLLVLFPPLIAGGGGGGSSGGGDGGSVSSSSGGGGAASKQRTLLRAEVEEARRKYGEAYTMEMVINDAWSAVNLGGFLPTR
ncbi:MAG: hypothetical protein GYA24_08005 [Candidatus Lokiarchaeota archaeon]|nr:hypothetical protein [Candidatus Lokiarchaeota archaeon]